MRCLSAITTPLVRYLLIFLGLPWSSLVFLGRYRNRLQNPSPEGRGQAATVPGMWLDDTRKSYDTVAESYADRLRGALAREPFQRGVLALFAELVRAAGTGPVADVGCGPGRITGYLHGAGLDVFGIDLSPAMIDLARQDHPGLRFEVGSMTSLDLVGESLTGLLAWFSLIHVPDEAIPTVLAEFHR